jgi:hypothetical protein
VPRQRDQLRDVHALISHPLDVLDHVEYRRDQTEVARHGRLEREQRQDSLVHLQVAAVDEVVLGDHEARQLHVALLQRLQRPVERGDDHVQPFQGALLEDGELVLEVEADPLGHRISPSSRSRRPQSAHRRGS